MCNANDFIIENGALTKYVGAGGHVTIPEGVHTIQTDVFRNDSITALTIPSSVKNVMFDNFETDAIVTEVYVSDVRIWLEMDFRLRYGCNPLRWVRRLYVNGEPLVKLEIPEAITEIRAEAFRGIDSLTEVIIHDGVTQIGASAFEGCKNLQRAVLSDSVVQIRGLFYGCSKLESVKLPAGLEKMRGTTFSGCSSLTAVTIPEGVTEISTLEFSNCVNLKEITIPDSVTKIYEDSFKNCGNLKTVNASDKIKELLFASVPAEKKMEICLRHLRNDLQSDDSFAKQKEEYIKKNKKKFISAILSADDVSALTGLLKLDKKVKLETLEEYVAQCGDSKNALAYLLDYKAKHFGREDVDALAAKKTEKAFGIKELSVADWRKIYKFSGKDGNVTIKEYKGEDTELIIPAMIGKNKVVAIGENFFWFWNQPGHFSRLTAIEFPDTLEEIGAKAFEQNTLLKTVKFGSGLRFIRENAFMNCISIEEVKLPDSLEIIESGTFFGCRKLQNIQIPVNVKRISGTAFKNCAELERVSIPASVTFIGYDAFGQCPKLTIYAPAGSYAETYAKENYIPFVVE